jgi:hypothetical protein
LKIPPFSAHSAGGRGCSGIFVGFESFYFYELRAHAKFGNPTTIFENTPLAEKQEMFEGQNRMQNIPANYPKPNEEYKCKCGKKEDMSHIYNCELLNNGNCLDLKYEKLYIGTISEQIQIFRHFEKNFKRREILKHDNECKNLLPRDPSEILFTQSSIVMD